MTTIIERSLRSLSTLRGFAPRYSIGRAAPSLIGLLKGADPGKGAESDEHPSPEDLESALRAVAAAEPPAIEPPRSGVLGERSEPEDRIPRRAGPGGSGATDRDRWSVWTTRLTRRESLLAMGATLLAACFSDRPDPTGNGNGNGTGVVVEMTPQLTFEPATVTIEAGQAVTWRNTSSFFHTATGDGSKANDPSVVALPEGASPWDSDVVDAGAEFTRTFDVPGEYRYFCIPHEAQDMVGSIVVLSS